MGTASVPGQVRLRLPSANYPDSKKRFLSPVGASLLAIAVCHLHQCRLTGRFREQARSHRGLGFSDWRV
ncbi:hypothetical protein EMIT0P260_30231 [Pseudomonas sp. IT-P260]